MEIIGLLQGHHKGQEGWIEEVSRIYHQYKYYDPKKRKLVPKLAQTRVSPAQLIRISIPEASLEDTLGMICPGGSVDYIRLRYPIINKAFNMLRKVLGLSKLPKDWKENKSYITNVLKNYSVGFHPIGLKNDEFHNDMEQL